MYTGDIYEGYGKTQPYLEGMKQELPGRWDFVWDYELDEGVHQAEQKLQELGIFKTS